MCEPMTMALLGVASAHASNKAEDAQYEWRKRMEELGTHNAVLANAVKQRQLGTQTQQKMRSVNDEIRAISRKGNQVAATAAVRATKGGLQADSGSVVALQAQFGRDALESIGVRTLEGRDTLTFSQQQAKAIEIETQARIDSVQAGPAPTAAGRFANLAIGAISGYMAGSVPGSGLEDAAKQGVTSAVPASSGASSMFGRTLPGGFNPMGAPLGAPIAPSFATPATPAATFDFMSYFSSYPSFLRIPYTGQYTDQFGVGVTRYL